MRRLLYIFLCLCVAIGNLCAQAVVPRKPDGRPTVAVVLSGGGAKGTAHLGALKVIEELGIPIDIIVGTSMGSIVGGLYCVGYTSEELLDVVRGTDWLNLILDSPDYGNTLLTSKKDQENYLLRVSLDRAKMFSGTNNGGIIHGRNITALMNLLVNGVPKDIHFNDLPIPFACVATDAISGKKFIFNEGNIVTAMRSSMAMPSIFTPVKYEDMLLVDGGIVDNYPVDVARDMGADLVIGVDLMNDVTEEELANSAFDVLMSMLDLISKDRYLMNIKNTDVYIKVNTSGYNAASFSNSAIDTLVQRGEDAARLKIEELRTLAKQIGVSQDVIATDHGRMSGVVYSRTPNEISRNLFAEDNDSIPENLYSAIQTSNLSLGARYDNQNHASLQVGLDVNLMRKKQVDLNLYARLGARLVGGISLTQHTKGGGEIQGQYFYEYKDMDYYFKSLRAMSMRDYHFSFNLQYKKEWRNVGFSFGAKYDVDRYRNLLIHKDIANVTENLKTERLFSYFLKAEYNSLNSLYFPTYGTQVEGKGELITSNLFNYYNFAPLFIASAYWRTAISITSSSVLIPHGSVRYIGSNDVELPFSQLNFVGGLHREMWKDQQIEMAGIPYLEIVNRNTIGVFGIEYQQRIRKNNFIVFKADGATISNGIDELFDERGLYYGFNLGYQYRGFAGPISLTGMWSSRTKEFGGVLNIGYYF